jgi:hypothetical protein
MEGLPVCGELVAEWLGPGPALLNEALERRVQILKAADLRPSAIRELEGDTNAEIVEKRGRTIRSVERKIERIHAYWELADV